ncbi:uncharacterized protein DUF3117 [Stackebrandtia albiflava]|uniref:Uncharacterized protein DUF3117 n=1 Tax=Stackebrandtia albiflava TaxID=406432 RepID=A0A562UPG6_9ACTN|nr:uncharacterized protein DUF3117 [Stackebrandtia albiflava]
MAAMKPRTGDGPLEVTKEGRGIVMRVPLEGGGRLVVEMTQDEVDTLSEELRNLNGLLLPVCERQHPGIHTTGASRHAKWPWCISTGRLRRQGGFCRRSRRRAGTTAQFDTARLRARATG